MTTTKSTGRPPDRGERDLAALAALGLRVTGPRRAILAALLESTRLVTPEQLLATARASAPATSLATVYRTLERLHAIGRLKRAPLATSAMGYAYCTPGHHDHAICTNCGQLVPIATCPISAPVIDGFQAASHVVDIYGLCTPCTERADRAALGGTQAPPLGAAWPEPDPLPE